MKILSEKVKRVKQRWKESPNGGALLRSLLGGNERWIPQGSLRSYGIPFRSVHYSKKWGPEPFSTSSHFLLVEGYPKGQYLPHTFRLLLHMDQASSHGIREQPWGRKIHVQFWSGVLSAWPWAPLELSSIAVPEIRPGNVFWGTKNVRYNFPDVLLEKNSLSSWILCSEVSIIPMAPITYCF